MMDDGFGAAGRRMLNDNGEGGGRDAWWHNHKSQDIAFQALAGAYGVIALVAVAQLIRIQYRVPEYGWTTQKVFHLLNFVCAGLRAASFPVRRSLDRIHPEVLTDILLDAPGLLFFTTYTLLVLFWAEIYHQARSLPTGGLRPTFVCVNVLVYAFQGALWVWAGADPNERHTLHKVSSLFLAVVSVFAAAGFVLYGGRLFAMLRRFPIESKGRRKKLREVGCVTAVCTSCFCARAVMVALSVFRAARDGLDVLDHPVRNVVYYSVCEIVPSALVLFILRKLPPRTQPAQQHQYHTIS